MPRDITITFGDGASHVYQNVPDDVTPDMAQVRAEKDFSKPVKGIDGGANAARKPLSDQIPGQRAEVVNNAARMPQSSAPDLSKDNLLGKAAGVVEAPMIMLSGMAGGVLGGAAGLYKGLTGGKYGTPEGVRDAAKTADSVSNAIAYKPSTQTGAYLAQKAGDAINASGIIGIPSAELATLGRAVSSSSQSMRNLAGANAGAMAVQDAEMVGSGGAKLSDLIRAPKLTMAGGGAALTAEQMLRAQRFANMRAPMNPTQGILSRTIDDVQFEREAAKRPEGKALDQRYAELNKGMGQQFDAMIDETGATATSRRATGKSFVNAVEAKKAAKKTEVDQAYKEARASGDMAEQIDVQPILDFVEKNRSAARNAGILHSIEDEANRLSAGTGKISLNDMEEMREMVGNLSEPGKPNGHYGELATKLIDQVTAGKGGPAYQQARRLNENMMKEFVDRDIIDKMLRNKPGTKDRAVSYDDVAQNIIRNGSLDDMKHAFRVLEAHPVGTAPEIVAAGQQAAKDLRGAAMADIKKRVFGNAGANSAGDTVGSQAKMKTIIQELDDEGKLEFLYGKKGAQEIRDTLDVATDIYTTPAGTVNSANTASAMEKVLDRMAGAVGGTPIVGHAVKYAAKKLESRNYSKRVDAALNPDKPTTPELPKKLSDMSGEKK